MQFYCVSVWPCDLYFYKYKLKSWIYEIQLLIQHKKARAVAKHIWLLRHHFMCTYWLYWLQSYMYLRLWITRSSCCKCWLLLLCIWYINCCVSLFVPSNQEEITRSVIGFVADTPLLYKRTLYVWADAHTEVIYRS